MDKRNKRITLAINLGIGVLILLFIYLFNLIFNPLIVRFLLAFTSIFLPFSIALFISYLMAPVFRLLEQKIKLKYRLLNTFIVFVAMAIIVYLFIRFAFGIIYVQGIQFLEYDWPNVVQSARNFLATQPTLLELYNSAIDWFNLENISSINVNIIGIFQSITSIIITIVLVPVFLFFILNDRKRIYESLVKVVPKNYRVHATELTKRAHYVIEQYFNGRFATMIVMSIVFTAAFFILGFKERSVLFGFMMGFFDIVPYVGPFIAMLLPVLYSLTDETLMFGQYAPIAVIIMVTVGQLVQNNVAQPLIMGKETQLHPLLVLSSFVFFGYLFGIVGIILAIPITGMIRTSIEYFHELNADKLALSKIEKQKIREDKRQ